MSKRNKQLQTVLITDADRGSAVAIIRSLNRKGWRVVAASADRLSPGFHSRHTYRSMLYPPPTTAAAEFVESMLAAVQRYEVDLIIPVTDETILPFARQRHRFDGLCQIAMPETHILEITRNKLQTMELARGLDVPIPLTIVVDTAEEAVACAGKFQWPIVLKPVFSRKYDPGSGKTDKFTVSYANDLETLTQKMWAYQGRSSVLMQEYYAGEGQGVELLACDGQLLAAFQHRRLCEIPVQGGASALRESVPLDPRLYEYARRLTAALEWTGLLMVEFKVGTQDAKLMEINGRIWGSLPLPVASGMDFPGRLADLYCGTSPKIDGAPTTTTNYRIGVQVANMEMLLMWIIQVLWGKQRYQFLPSPARREALPIMLKLLSLRLRYDILSLSDPRPALIVALKIGRKAISKLGTLRSKKVGGKAID